MKMRLVLATADRIEKETNETLENIVEAGGQIEGVSPVAHLGNGEMALTLFYTENEPSNKEAMWEATWKALREKVQRRIVVYDNGAFYWKQRWIELKREESSEDQSEGQVEKVENCKRMRDRNRNKSRELQHLLDYMDFLEGNKEEVEECQWNGSAKVEAWCEL